MNWTVVVGYIISLIGTAILIYGYFWGHYPPAIDWHAYMPWWIADYLSNGESEVGMTIIMASMLAMYWPSSREVPRVYCKLRAQE